MSVATSILLIYPCSIAHALAKMHDSLMKNRRTDLWLRQTEDTTILDFFFYFLARVSCREPQCLWPPCPAEAQLYLTVILLCQPESLLLAARGPAEALRAGSGEGLAVCLLVCFGCACVLVCLPRGKQNGTYRHYGSLRACVFVCVCSRVAHCHLTKPFRSA